MAGTRGSKGTLAERLFAKISVEEPGGCWVWIGARSGVGYGAFRESPDRPQTNAHRVMYELVHGRLPGRNLVVDHLCRNPSCVNPAHLEAVTQKENMRRGIKGVLTTHCPRGHPYDERNTYTYSDRRGTYRKCRACHAQRERDKRAARGYVRKPAKTS